MWRECIKKVWEVDPLIYPKCTGDIKLISFIYKKTVIKKMLKHLDLNDEKEPACTSCYGRGGYRVSRNSSF